MADKVNDSSQVLTKLENLTIEKNGNNKANSNLNSDSEVDKWGLPLVEVYKLAVSFYKGECC